MNKATNQYLNLIQKKMSKNYRPKAKDLNLNKLLADLTPSVTNVIEVDFVNKRIKSQGVV